LTTHETNTGVVSEIANNPLAIHWMNRKTSEAFKIAKQDLISVHLPTPIPVAAHDHEH